jgi:hypothetical protein
MNNAAYQDVEYFAQEITPIKVLLNLLVKASFIIAFIPMH